MKWGADIARKLSQGSILALHGPLGAGKTALTKGIANGLGVRDIVTSPTFTLVSEYIGNDIKIYHMDLYRIDSYEDFIMIGGDDLLYNNGICIIEWAEKIKDDLPAETIDIFIGINEDLSRTIRMSREI